MTDRYVHHPVTDHRRRLPSSGGRQAHQPPAHARASAARFGIAWERYRLIGVAELAAAFGVLAGLVWRPLGLLAGLGLALLLLGAVVTHLRAGDSGREVLPAVLILVIDALYLAVAVTG